MDKTRRLIAAAALLFPFLGSPSFAREIIPISDIETYLNKITTLSTTFTQVAWDGEITTGRVFISRPGKIRFEYDPPSKALVIAGAQKVAIFDPKSNQPPEQYPLRRTPLSLMLAKDIKLGRAKMVVGHEALENNTRIRLQDPYNPQYGWMEMVFTDNPVQLRQWVTGDDTGVTTTVILNELTKGEKFPLSHFDIDREIEKRMK